MPLTQLNNRHLQPLLIFIHFSPLLLLFASIHLELHCITKPAHGLFSPLISRRIDPTSIDRAEAIGGRKMTESGGSVEGEIEIQIQNRMMTATGESVQRDEAGEEMRRGRNGDVIDDCLKLFQMLCMI